MDFFREEQILHQVRMAMVNREAKRDVTVSKDALLKSYSKRLKDDVRSLADNFSAIVKTCRFSGMKTIGHGLQLILSSKHHTLKNSF